MPKRTQQGKQTRAKRTFRIKAITGFFTWNQENAIKPHSDFLFQEYRERKAYLVSFSLHVDNSSILKVQKKRNNNSINLSHS